MLSHYLAPSVSLGWALSLAVSFPFSDKAAEVSELLLKFHIEEYPITTLQLVSHEDSPFSSSKTVAAALGEFRDETAWLMV